VRLSDTVDSHMWHSYRLHTVMEYRRTYLRMRQDVQGMVDKSQEGRVLDVASEELVLSYDCDLSYSEIKINN
jgi:hypothetical protein